MLLIFISASFDTLAQEDKINYEEHVRPILADRCLSCHNPDKAKGGLDLSTYSATMQGGSSGEIVNPGDPSGSRLYLSVTHKEEPIMPPKGEKLAKDKLDLISSWISSGLLENSGSKAKKAKPTFNLALETSPTGKPDGPPPMPESLTLEPVATSLRAASALDIASSPWAPLIAIAVPKQVLLYNSNNLQLNGILPFPEGTPSTLSFSRNGSILIAGGGRGGKLGKVIGWEIKTGKRVFDIGSEFDSVLAADITSDHSLVALGGPGKRVKIYETLSGDEIANIKKHTDWVTSLSFSPDGVLLATGDRNGGLYVWEAQTGSLFYTLKAHTKSVTAISWRSDSNVVSSASEDGSIRLWEMNEGKQVKTWTGHGGGVLDMTFTGDGRIASCGRDRTAKVWDANGTQKMATKVGPEIIVTTSFNHNGTKLISGSWDGTIQIHDTADGKLIGNILGNPPHIATRIEKANSQTKLTKQKFNKAKNSHQESLAQLNPVIERIDSINNQLKEKREIKINVSNQLRALKTSLDSDIKNQKESQQNILNFKKEESDIVKSLEETKADPEKTKLLQAQLTLIHAEIKIKEEEVEKINTRISAHRLEIKKNETLLFQTDKEITNFESQLKTVTSQKSSLDETVKSKLSVLNSFNIDSQKASSQLTFWQAQKFNHERHQKLKERLPIEGLFNQSLADYEAASTKQINLTTAREQKEKELQDVRELISENQKKLQIAIDENFRIKARIEIDKTILENRKSTLKTIESVDGEIKKEYEAEIIEETNKIKEFAKRISSNTKSLETQVPDAKSKLAKSLKFQQEIEKQLKPIIDSESKHLIILKELKSIHSQSEKKLKSFDINIMRMHEEFLNMLPKS
ncbi:MAG: c-type cytochrome domain-containing protein [Verrucomicrobiales bacterium]